MLAMALLLPPLHLSTPYLSTSTIVALCVFFTLLGTCVIIGHLLEENRWANESIIALLLVHNTTHSTHSSSLHVGTCNSASRVSILIYYGTFCLACLKNLQGLCAGTVVLFVTNFQSAKILIFSEDLFFLYLLPPIIFNAGLVCLSVVAITDYKIMIVL